MIPMLVHPVIFTNEVIAVVSEWNDAASVISPNTPTVNTIKVENINADGPTVSYNRCNSSFILVELWRVISIPFYSGHVGTISQMQRVFWHLHLMLHFCFRSAFGIVAFFLWMASDTSLGTDRFGGRMINGTLDISGFNTRLGLVFVPLHNLNSGHEPPMVLSIPNTIWFPELVRRW